MSCATVQTACARAAARPRVLAALASVLIWCLAFPPAAFAQGGSPNLQHTKNTPDLGFRSDLKVDPSTLALSIQIPVGNYPGRAGMNTTLGLHYNSKVWRMEYEDYVTGTMQGCGENVELFTGFECYTTTVARYAEKSVAGWTFIGTLPTIEFNDERFNTDGRPCCQNTQQGLYIPRMTVRFSDGSTHELRRGDAPLTGSDHQTGIYYSVDASRMKFVGTSPGAGTLYLPDGSRYIFAGFTATHYIDRNGNMQGGQDTLGRSITQPTFHNGFEHTASGSVPGVGGEPMNYTFDLRQLGSPGVLEPDMVTGQARALHRVGDSDKFGNNVGVHTPSLFASIPGTRVIGSGFHDPVVLHRVVLPDGSAYKFTYNEYGEIAKVVYPTGGYERYRYAQVGTLSHMEEPYTQANRGVVERRVSARGDGSDEVTWLYGTAEGNLAPDETRTVRKLHTGYAFGTVVFGFDDPRAGMAYDERVYAPKSEGGAMLRRTLTDWGVSGPQPGGHASAKRDPKVLKKVELLLDTGTANALAKTTTYEYGQASQPLNVTAVTEHAYVEVPRAVAEEGKVGDIPRGGALRTTETAYKDEDAYNERNLVALPVRTTIRAGGSEASTSPGPIVARTEINYDEKSYYGTDLSLLPCGATAGRESVITDARGNATTVSRWLDTRGAVDNSSAYLDSHTRYDQCGNSRKTWDAAVRGTVSPRILEVEYSADYQFAYPTRTISPIPDSTGTNGSKVRLEETKTYDFATGFVLTATDANEQTTSYSYADPDTGTVDSLSRLRKVTQPDGGWTRYDFGNTPGGFLVRARTAIDAARSTDSYQYFDGLGRPSRAYSFDGSAPERTWVATKTQRYEKTRQVKVSNPHFRSNLDDFDLDSTSNTVPVSISTSDPLGRVTGVLSPDGATAATEYKGARVTVTDQDLRQRRIVSDSLGRLEKVVEAPGVSGYGYETTYEYDALGNLRKVTQGKAAEAQQTRFFEYDSLSRLTSATNPESGTVNYEYDAAGNLTKKVDARHVQTHYSYDALNRIVGRSHSVESGHQPPAGFVNTPAVNFYYDGKGMPSEGGVQLPEPDHSAGRLTAMKSSVSETIYTEFDVSGRVKRHRQVVGPGTGNVRTYLMAYEYDLMGNLRSQTYPSGKVVETEYDGAGRVAGVKNRAGGGYYVGAADASGHIEYTAHGAVSAMKLGNGLWEHTHFNTRLQPVEIGLGATKDDPATSGSVLRLEYTYEGLDAAGNLEHDNNGNVRSQRIVAPGLDLTQKYDYDHLNRLESAQELKGGAQQWKQVYKYDQFGNRRFDAGTTLPSLPGTLVDMVNNPEVNAATNRLKERQDADATNDYEYDAAGNLTRDAHGRTFAYDANNMQVTFNGGPDPGTNGASYSYDGAGRRVKKVTGQGTTVFVYDAGGALVADYSTEAPQPGPGGVKYLTADNLGTPRVITDKDGKVVSRHDYQPFGEELPVGVGGRAGGTGPGREYVFGVKDDGVRQQFTAQERDRESGLDYFDARYYSSTQGRFTSTDPLAASASAGNPQSWNRYAYVLNNPLKFVDPDGMNPQRASRRQASSTVVPKYVKDVLRSKVAHATSVIRPDGSKAWATVVLPSGFVNSVTQIGISTFRSTSEIAQNNMGASSVGNVAPTNVEIQRESTASGTNSRERTVTGGGSASVGMKDGVSISGNASTQHKDGETSSLQDRAADKVAGTVFNSTAQSSFELFTGNLGKIQNLANTYAGMEVPVTYEDGATGTALLTAEYLADVATERINFATEAARSQVKNIGSNLKPPR